MAPNEANNVTDDIFVANQNNLCYIGDSAVVCTDLSGSVAYIYREVGGCGRGDCIREPK